MCLVLLPFLGFPLSLSAQEGGDLGLGVEQMSVNSFHGHCDFLPMSERDRSSRPEASQNYIPLDLPSLEINKPFTRSFYFLKSFKGREIYLHVGASSAERMIQINGCLLAILPVMKEAQDLNITDFVRVGDSNVFSFHCLSAQSEPSFCYVFARTKQRIEQVEVKTSLDKRLFAGYLNIQLQKSEPMVASIRMELPDGIPLVIMGVKPEQNKCFYKLKGIRTWSAENPNYYRLRVEAGGEIIWLNVGFRKLEVCRSLLKVNNKTCYLRAKSYPKSKKSQLLYYGKGSLEQYLANLKIKGVNTLFADDYPNEWYFYELCDRMGFYVFPRKRELGLAQSEQAWSNHPCLLPFDSKELLIRYIN